MTGAIVTRFAPSPTGLLHLGHAHAALFAWVCARGAGGRFLLRIEDIDRSRCRPEFSEAILEAYVKEPLLAQVDNVLRYICNGFIADTPRTGAAYTEDERREVFESSVKLLASHRTLTIHSFLAACQAANEGRKKRTLR